MYYTVFNTDLYRKNTEDVLYPYFRLHLKSVVPILLVPFCAAFVLLADAAFCRCNAYHRAQMRIVEAHVGQAAEWRRIRDRDYRTWTRSGGTENSRAVFNLRNLLYIIAAGSRGRNNIGCFACDAATKSPTNGRRK